MRICRADKIGVFDAQSSDKLFEIEMRLIDKLLRRQPCFGSFGGVFVAMLVGASLKFHLTAILPVVARPDIGDQIIKGVANVGFAIDIGNSGRDVEFFAHYHLL